MSIQKEDVLHIAKLSRLEFNEKEQETFLSQFNNILGQVDLIAGINTDGVEPTAHVVQKQNVLREDIAKPSMENEKLLQNAPEKEDSAYLVPQVVE